MSGLRLPALQTYLKIGVPRCTRCPPCIDAGFPWYTGKNQRCTRCTKNSFGTPWYTGKKTVYQCKLLIIKEYTWYTLVHLKIVMSAMQSGVPTEL